MPDAMPCYAMLCYAMLCYAMLYYAMLCYAMLCCAMLRYATLRYALFAAICPSKTYDIHCCSRSLSRLPCSVVANISLSGDQQESLGVSHRISTERDTCHALCPHCIYKHSIITPVMSMTTNQIGTCMRAHTDAHIAHSTCLHTYTNMHTHAGWVRGYWREGGHAMHAVPPPHLQAQHDQARSVIMPRVR